MRCPQFACVHASSCVKMKGKTPRPNINAEVWHEAVTLTSQRSHLPNHPAGSSSSPPGSRGSSRPGSGKPGDAAHAAVSARSRRSQDQRVLRTVSAPHSEKKMAAVAEEAATSPRPVRRQHQGFAAMNVVGDCAFCCSSCMCQPVSRRRSSCTGRWR